MSKETTTISRFARCRACCFIFNIHQDIFDDDEDFGELPSDGDDDDDDGDDHDDDENDVDDDDDEDEDDDDAHAKPAHGSYLCSLLRIYILIYV